MEFKLLKNMKDTITKSVFKNDNTWERTFEQYDLGLMIRTNKFQAKYLLVKLDDKQIYRLSNDEIEIFKNVQESLGQCLTSYMYICRDEEEYVCKIDIEIDTNPHLDFHYWDNNCFKNPLNNNIELKFEYKIIKV